MTEEVLEQMGEQETVPEVQETEQQVQTPGELDVLKDQLSNLEKKLGEQGNELGNLRNENAYYRMQSQQVQHPQAPEVGNPVGSVDEYDPYDLASVNRCWAKKQAEIDKQVNEKFNQFAQYNHKQAVNMALNRGRQIVAQNPDIFKGNEKEVITMVSNLAMSGNIQPDLLENPTTWFGVNDMVAGEKARKQRQVSPMASTVIDTPSQVRPTEAPVKEDMGIPQNIVDELFGGDRALATKMARESRERGEK